MSTFLAQYNGPLTGLMRWPQWDSLTATLINDNNGEWYVYYVGEEVPATTLKSDMFEHFMDAMNTLLHRDHQEDYLGIVYVDDVAVPEFIKIYDPNNLGSSCGSIGYHVLPGWILSRCAPVDLKVEFPNTAGRRRWWKGLLTK